ncbi:MAG: SDR family NAD(P)-dependent oxidoreductase [Myxococcota bacterium]
MSAVRDKVIVVTGASRGLGRGLAEAWSRQGAKLGLCARTEPVVPAGAQAVVAAVDVRDREALRSFSHEVEARLGPIDLWVNNAGVLDPIGFVRELDEAEFAAHWAVNVHGVLFGSQCLIESAHRRADGFRSVLVNISSGAAHKGYAAWGAYCAAKAAVERLTEVIALEEPGVRAYAIAPGVIDTAMQELIRRKTEAEFPRVGKFRELKEKDAFNRPEYIAWHLGELAFRFDAYRARTALEGGDGAWSLRLPNQDPDWSPSRP